MVVLRRLAAPVAVLAALAFAAPALAQSPGDDQYSDPFGSGGGGGGNSHPSATPTPAATAAPSTPSSTSTSTSTSSSSAGTATSASTASAAATPVPAATAAAPVTASQDQLPYTGADAGLLALAGALCIGGGVALRVRLRVPE